MEYFFFLLFSKLNAYKEKNILMDRNICNNISSLLFEKKQRKFEEQSIKSVKNAKWSEIDQNREINQNGAELNCIPICVGKLNGKGEMLKAQLYLCVGNWTLNFFKIE